LREATRTKKGAGSANASVKRGESGRDSVVWRRASIMGIRAALALSLAWLGGSMDAAAGGEPAAGPRAGAEGRITMPGSPFGVAWGFLYGYPGTKAEVFLPQLRQLGAGCTKLYLTWSQIEPKQGGFDWQAVDTFLGQLQSPDEALIAVWSSSTWATRRASPLPLSSNWTRPRSEEHTSELQSLTNLVCRLLLEKKNRPPGHDRPQGSES